MNSSRRIALSLAVAAVAIVPPAIALAAPPPNDNFGSSAPFPADGATYAGNNSEATPESFEPDHAGIAAAHSLWYSWTPQAGGTAHLHTCDSAFNTRVAVYTGNSLDALTLVADNEDSLGPTCNGTAWAELSFGVVPGTTYRIAVDTSGGVTPAGAADNNNPPLGTARLVLTPPSGGPQEEPPADPPPAADDKTNPGAPVQPSLRTMRIPRLIASCGDKTPKGNAHCEQGPFEFPQVGAIGDFFRRLEARGIATLTKDASAKASTAARTVGQQKALREKAYGGELMNVNLDLVNPDGSTEDLVQGKKYRISTDQTVTIAYTYFYPAKDRQAIAEEKEALRKEAEREARGNQPSSKCLPIAAGQSNKQILDQFPPDASGYRSYLDMFDKLAKLGCQVEIAKYVRGKPSAPRSYVTDVVGRDAKRATISVVLAQPGSHDFIFAIREEASQWLANQNKNNIPLGTDGRLTVSDGGQLNRFTVQVIERASGRFVAGIPVTFRGATQTTDGNGETTFTSLIRTADKFRLSAEYKDMEGWRTISSTDRGSKSFVSMAGRNIKASQGRFVGSDVAQLDLAASLPVLPANLGTGDVGEIVSIPRVQQAAVTAYDATGRASTGQHNVVALEKNSNVLVGAGPGLLALGGGDTSQAGRRLARAGTNNPLGFLGSILGPLKSAIDSTASNIRTALSGANQAAIAAVANALRAPSSNLISDKGLGVISTGGGNLIGQAGGNLISDKGLGVISNDGASLIGQAGGNLISDKGLGVISTGGGNLTPVFGGKIISRDGAG